MPHSAGPSEDQRGVSRDSAPAARSLAVSPAVGEMGAFSRPSELPAAQSRATGRTTCEVPGPTPPPATVLPGEGFPPPNTVRQLNCKAPWRTSPEHRLPRRKSWPVASEEVPTSDSPAPGTAWSPHGQRGGRAGAPFWRPRITPVPGQGTAISPRAEGLGVGAPGPRQGVRSAPHSSAPVWPESCEWWRLVLQLGRAVTGGAGRRVGAVEGKRAASCGLSYRLPAPAGGASYPPATAKSTWPRGPVHAPPPSSSVGGRLPQGVTWDPQRGQPMPSVPEAWGGQRWV